MKTIPDELTTEGAALQWLLLQKQTSTASNRLPVSLNIMWQPSL